VGTAQAGLTSEIVVGTTPGGELGGTWASPTVDSVHAGSAHLALGSTGSTAAAGNHTHAGGGAAGLPWIANLYYPSMGASFTGALRAEGETGPDPRMNRTLVLNRVYASPIYIPAAYSITHLAMVVGGAVGSATGRVGLYTDNGGRPGALVASTAGGHNWTGAGFGEYTVGPVAAGPGWYWVALVGQVAAPNVIVFSPLATGFAALGNPNPASVGVLVAGFGVDGVTGALPDPWGTPATWYETTTPAVWLRRA
jgi:hypothetical protein